jgi:hypothetical protein
MDSGEEFCAEHSAVLMARLWVRGFLGPRTLQSAFDALNIRNDLRMDQTPPSRSLAYESARLHFDHQHAVIANVVV